jgi:hypothetical protein
VWHASIGVFDGAPRRPVAAWSPKQWARAIRLGQHLLRGRGTGEVYLKGGRWVVHVRRSLSPEEIAGLDPAWLAIPAVDIAG